MGKIRATTIGSDQEQEQKEEAKKRREAKKQVKSESRAKDERTILSPTTDTAKKESARKKQVKKKSAKKVRSTRYKENIQLRDKSKQYTLLEALDILLRMKKARFDESLEMHINTTEKAVSGDITLPYGTGKQTKVTIISPATDPSGAETIINTIAEGKIDFDILIATPDAMPKLAKVARILGPRGLMPNPKNGTITTKPEEVAKKFAGGQMHFKTESKTPIIHFALGKLSFGKEKLQKNSAAFLEAIDSKKIKSNYLKSTMSPSLRIQMSK